MQIFILFSKLINLFLESNLEVIIAIKINRIIHYLANFLIESLKCLHILRCVLYLFLTHSESLFWYHGLLLLATYETIQVILNLDYLIIAFCHIIFYSFLEVYIHRSLAILTLQKSVILRLKSNAWIYFFLKLKFIFTFWNFMLRWRFGLFCSPCIW